MRNPRWTMLHDIVPRLLLALSLVAVLCHVDNFMLALQPLQDQEQSSPDDFFEERPRNPDLSRFLEARYRVPPDVAARIVNGAYAAAAETKQSPTLILAMVAVESRANPLSDNGADKGLMQVNPRWNPDRVAEVGGVSGLFDVNLNMRAGARILQRNTEATKGDIRKALRRYNGGTFDNGYAAKVLAEKSLIDKVAYRNGMKPRPSCKEKGVRCYT